MPLRLRQAVPGRPNVCCPQSTGAITAYASSSNVVLLTPESNLAETLEFWLALPHRASSSKKGQVDGVVCVSHDGYIIAWSDSNVVVWKHQPRSLGRSKWSIHSTIVASSPISCLDFHSGSLTLGTHAGIEYWRINAGSDVVVWDRLWERHVPEPTSIKISPCSNHICWFKKDQKCAYIMTIDRTGKPAGVPQEVRHPREIAWIGWRKSGPTGDPYLYTITTNSVFRIYSPVLDDPVWFQLLHTLDHRAFSRLSTPASTAKGKMPEGNGFEAMWVWDAEVVKSAIRAQLEQAKVDKPKGVEAGMKILESMETEESDVVAWAGLDGGISLRSIINMDRKPPTLLKSLPLAWASLPSLAPASQWSPQTLLLHIPGSSNLTAVLAPSSSCPHTSSFRIPLLSLLSSIPDSIYPTSSSSPEGSTPVQLDHSITSLIRTPNGRGLLALSEQGGVSTWYKQQLGFAPSSWDSTQKPLVGKGQWKVEHAPRQGAMFSKGRAIVFYTKPADGPATVTLQHLNPGSATPLDPLVLPHFNPSDDDEIGMLLAVSDIDDGFDRPGRRTNRAIITAATHSGEAWVWRASSRLNPNGDAPHGEQPTVSLLSHYRLPLDRAHGQNMVLPVDPMGWHQNVIDWATNTPLQDMILSISADGDLEFWTPKLGQHLVGEKANEEEQGGMTHPDRACEVNGGHSHSKGEGRGEDEPWVRTGVVKTGRKNVKMARCSSRKKTVLVCELEDGRQEMTIWDSKVSEFSTGWELTRIYEASDKIQDLDWTTTSDLQSVLAVGFRHRIDLICEQRMSYAETTPGWAPFLSIDMSAYTGVPINDSIWLAGGSLAVGAGNQVYMFSRFLEKKTGEKKEEAVDEEEDIFQLIAHQNGPLVDYHPVMLAQCLLWDKSTLVKSILERLVKALKECQEEGKTRLRFERLDPIEFYSSKVASKPVKACGNSDQSIVTDPYNSEEEDDFSPKTVSDLVDRLHGPVDIPLDDATKSFLATVAQVTLEVKRQRRSLDICGMRYLTSIRMSVNWDRIHKTSGNVTPPSGTGLGQNLGASGKGASHLSFRNIVWAMHSESQDILMEAATQCCSNGKMVWKDAKKFGVFLWLKSAETAKSQLEVIARNRFMADEDRDPTSCSLLFFALGKKKVVHGLWRQAPDHKEQQLMLKFLANDFTLDRWKTAAAKNAYALLSKQRYEYAAAFFMLAGQAKDAINVCLRQLGDWQLGLALARVVEGGTEGLIYRNIVSETVLPMAFEGGHRWLATWAFWVLGRRDLSVRVLISPMGDVASSYEPEKALKVGNPDNDDPALLLMFQYLEAKSLQTAKGTSEVSAKMEFDFVLHNARVFFRMGCHNLALDLLRSWSFERPFFPVNRRRRMSSISQRASTPQSSTFTSTNSPSDTLVSPSRRRRPSFLLSGTNGRPRESLFMDLDVLAESGGSTRDTSPANVEDEQPKPQILNGQPKAEEPASVVKEEPKAEEPPPKKVGNLMKELKQDVQQGAMEFDMDSFF
ncbi:WD-repeat protein [Cryptococcus wingfieldii CBS 7118]|uniref:WD-repeat protein n=1 Tax=Cryptococcus wingfieldii CBS 7118 TaxID=1295528 RepID=A0A1E3JPX9_9TREE|nr:WD-repeat protein [Cryptococcus wingfieldii CBS 7118]ODO01962.1 WD-repeat protein [Cryptococcus wingfieldii CBS 7118]